jgi:Protein of unknown function (DUF1553)/Protein of unknown function (DUF1549)/Planctomycete cytochrome C
VPMLSRTSLLLPITLAALVFCLSSSPRGSDIDPKRLPPAAAHKIDFVKDVQPILATTCYSCHDQRKQRGDYRIDSRQAALAGNRILPGKSADSPLIHYVAGVHPDRKMPPSGTPLTPRQVGILRAWIDQGAVWPDTALAGSREDQHWSLQPLVKPAVPAVKNTAWVRNPLDAFVLARLEAKGMSPAPAADKETLLRRVTFDLTGLPPTLAEREAFLADKTPEAYEKVVDRLLASPRYGERWARHWMDVIHFAETHGHDQDVPRESAWPYRDYLIRSFNTDKPYARFVEEQIAGDILFPEDPQAVIGLGMIAAGPWDESSQQSIRDDTLDKKVAQNLDRDDMITTVMSTFVSATVHCARCHNHKFDPISQAEYYSLQAVFAGVDRANRPCDLDPLVAGKRKELLARKALLNGPRTNLVALLTAPETKADVLAWERGARRDVWTVLDPVRFTSLNGATPTKQADHSVVYLGSRPEKDVYEITAVTDLEGVTAVRLEVLADDRLPHKGPGRQDNGNLHLSEFSVQAAPRDNPKFARPVSLRNAIADFNQDGWDVTRSIDGNAQTAWGIYPQVGKPHQAVFEFRDPLTLKGGASLTFVLEQLHGGGHLIGRVRLSITTAPRPVGLSLLPESIGQILAVPAERRTADQIEQLTLHVLRRQLENGLAALPPPQLVYAAAPDFQPNGSFNPARGCRPIHLLRRGDVNKPADLASPGALGCVPGLEARFRLADPNDEGSRRAALARWISDPKNVLTWRSIVNRVWHYHFGRGIVATPSDLGRMGARPTHPELLDWLAIHFRDEQKGSLKQLHRLIVTSAVYRQSSRHNPDHARVDSDNLLLWRMNIGRLDAESVRDAVLAISGKLDLTMGGPSVKQFLQTPGIHVTPNVDYQKMDVDGPGMYRRSVYRFLFRTLPDPLMDALDCPDASQFAPTRATSVTALQALAMLNDRFMIRQSEHFAARLQKESSGLEEQIRRAYLLALGRPAADKESAALSAYASRHGLTNACRVLFNCNEFLFVP